MLYPINQNISSDCKTFHASVEYWPTEKKLKMQCHREVTALIRLLFSCQLFFSSRISLKLSFHQTTQLWSTFNRLNHKKGRAAVPNSYAAVSVVQFLTSEWVTEWVPVCCSVGNFSISHLKHDFATKPNNEATKEYTTFSRKGSWLNLLSRKETSPE